MSSDVNPILISDTNVVSSSSKIASDNYGANINDVNNDDDDDNLSSSPSKGQSFALSTKNDADAERYADAQPTQRETYDSGAGKTTTPTTTATKKDDDDRSHKSNGANDNQTSAENSNPTHQEAPPDDYRWNNNNNNNSNNNNNNNSYHSNHGQSQKNSRDELRGIDNESSFTNEDGEMMGKGKWAKNGNKNANIIHFADDRGRNGANGANGNVDGVAVKPTKEAKLKEEKDVRSSRNKIKSGAADGTENAFTNTTFG